MFKRCCCIPAACPPYVNGTRPPRVLVTLAGYVGSTDCPGCAAYVNGSYILDPFGCAFSGSYTMNYLCPTFYIVASLGFLFQKTASYDELLISFNHTFGTNTSDLYRKAAPSNPFTDCGPGGPLRDGDYTVTFTGSDRLFIAGECNGASANVTVESLWT